MHLRIINEVLLLERRGKWSKAHRAEVRKELRDEEAKRTLQNRRNSIDSFSYSDIRAKEKELARFKLKDKYHNNITLQRAGRALKYIKETKDKLKELESYKRFRGFEDKIDEDQKRQYDRYKNKLEDLKRYEKRYQEFLDKLKSENSSDGFKKMNQTANQYK